MTNLTEETWEADMFAAVDANHRRAVRKAGESQEPEQQGMVWACLVWIVIMAAIAATCVVYAAM